MNQNELNKILENHKLWLNDGYSGCRAILTDAILTNADLTGAILTNADLTGAILTNATLRYAILTNADLTGAILTNADLTNADLTGADLTDAILTNAILTNADLTDAILTDAILTDAILTNADLTDATFNNGTVFPKGFDPIVRGMKLAEGEEVEVAAGTAAAKTLREELSEVLAKHGFDLVSLAIQPSKKHTNQG